MPAYNNNTDNFKSLVPMWKTIMAVCSFIPSVEGWRQPGPRSSLASQCSQQWTSVSMGESDSENKVENHRRKHPTSSSLQHTCVYAWMLYHTCTQHRHVQRTFLLKKIIYKKEIGKLALVYLTSSLTFEILLRKELGGDPNWINIIMEVLRGLWKTLTGLEKSWTKMGGFWKRLCLKKKKLGKLWQRILFPGS